MSREPQLMPTLAVVASIVRNHANASTLSDGESAEACEMLFHDLIGTVRANSEANVAHLLQHMVGVILSLIWYDAEGNEIVDTVPAVMERLEAAMDIMALEAARAELEGGDG